LTLLRRPRSLGTLKVCLYMYFEMTFNVWPMEDNSFKLCYVIEHMLYYHTWHYLFEYLQGQGHFDPSEIGSKMCSKVPVVTIYLGRKFNQALMCTLLLL
jgi:hypothetical protein